MAKEKYFLGISLGFNSSACLFSDKRGLIFAISQERLNGIKNTKEVPYDAISKCLKAGNVREVEKVGICHYQNITADNLKKYLPENYKLIPIFNYIHCYNKTGLNVFMESLKTIFPEVVFKKIERVEHHTAHAYSAYCFYGLPYTYAETGKASVVVTCDGFGDGVSGRISLTNGEVLSTKKLPESIGLIYQFVTGALGFKEHQHEGKITGLAAYGVPKYMIYDKDDCFDIKNVELTEEQEDNFNDNIEHFEQFLKLKNKTYSNIKRLNKKVGYEHIAASIQKKTENIISSWIDESVKKYKNPLTRDCDNTIDVYLAGGVFANVKLNKVIKELPWVNNLYITPPMGDEGTSIGAGLFVMQKCIGEEKAREHFKRYYFQTPFLGTEKPENKWEVINSIANYSHSECFSDYLVSEADLIKFIAEKLANGKIVCRVDGKMEFGPRALGNRSIFYNCDSYETNDWLNKKLGRTEFMPFAPVCRIENAEDLFYNIKGVIRSASYMTIALDCKPEFIENYPAAVHVDNTARPQFVDKENFPFLYSLLLKYENMTGKKALINTSFNLHNNPLIESVETACDNWFKSKIDVLSIGKFVLLRK